MGFMDLFRPKWRHSDPDVRLAAVKKLTDQNVLAKVAKNASDRFVGRAAVEKLTDQNVLAEVAKNASDWGTRKAAVKKLTDQQNALAEVAKNDSDEDVRQAAVEKLTDRNALAEVAKNDSDWCVRKTAFEQLGDQQNALAEVARNAYGSDRQAALIQLGDRMEKEDLMPLLTDLNSISESAKKRAAGYLKDIYFQKNLPAELKKLILQYKGRVVTKHKDTARNRHSDQKAGHQDQIGTAGCGDGSHIDNGRWAHSDGVTTDHTDTPTEYFNL